MFFKYKCPFWKKCSLYNKESDTCNRDGGKRDMNEWYCGKAKIFAEK